MRLTQILLSVFLCFIIIGCKNEKKTDSSVDKTKKENVSSKNKDIIEAFKANAIINFEYLEKIKVKDGKGNELGFIQNEEEDFISLNIKKDSLQYFYVKAISYISEKSIEGWIKKANYIGTYARNYEEGKDLNLYEKADRKSKITSTIKQWIPDFYTINKFNNSWAYVSITYKGKDYSGWLSPEMQCPNSYSTCN